MKWKKALLGLGLLVAVSAGMAYVFLLGFTKVTEIKPNLYTLHNESPLARIGSNVVAFNTGDSWVVVDTHLRPLAGGALSALKNIAALPVSFAFNTHWHPDHSGGNAVFSDEAEIIAHANVRQTLASAHGATGLTAPGSIHQYDPVATPGLPEKLVTDRLTVLAGGQEFHALHYAAAHTNGDLVIFAPGFGAIVVGDLIWPGGFPSIDMDNGGSAHGLLHALNAVRDQASPNTRIIPGHGPVMTVTELDTYINMVAATIALVDSGLDEGKTLDQLKADGLGPQWADWSGKLMPEASWIEAIAASSARR